MEARRVTSGRLRTSKRSQRQVTALGRLKFIRTLPMTPTGKTQKYVLRQHAADGTLTFDEIRPPRSLSQAQS